MKIEINESLISLSPQIESKDNTFRAVLFMNLAVIALTITGLFFKTIQNQGVSVLDFGLARALFNVIVASLIHRKLEIKVFANFPTD